MRVFKTTYKDRRGRTKKAANWYVEFKDHREYVRRLSAFPSKAASEEMGRSLDKLVSYHKASGGQTDPALIRFLTVLPAKMREKLVAIGLLAPDRVAVSKAISEHLNDFAAALGAKGNSPFHVEVVSGRARRVFNGCGFRFYGDISASKVMEHLDGLRAGSKDKPGIGAQTFNFYVQACKQFCRWAVKDRRALENPLTHLEGLNVKTDRRRDRRPFTVEELRRLLDAARTSPARFDMLGEDRAVLYWLAVETGLRAGELRSLTRGSFALDAEPPTVTVGAAYSKHRREDTLPLRPALVAALRSFLACKLPSVPMFKIPTDRKSAARMFQADLAAANIVYRDEDGRVADFHALRHTFITNLANGGVHPKTAQSLARHCTISLTMDRYSHTLREQEAEALAALPDLDRPAAVALAATATDNARSLDKHQNVLASCLALPGGQMGTLVGAGGLSAGDTVESQSLGDAGISAENPAFGSVCTSGGGPGLQNQWRV